MRVITFSQKFPSYHPKAGLWTHFPHAILTQQGIDFSNDKYMLWLIENNEPEKEEACIDFFVELESSVHDSSEKSHTIRAGNRWKEGDKFSPRVWSGKPYNSPQIIIAPDIEIVKTWQFKIEGFKIYIDHVLFYEQFSSRWHDDIEKLARNDALSCSELYSWFKMPTIFDGQIVCWNPNINY